MIGRFLIVCAAAAGVAASAALAADPAPKCDLNVEGAWLCHGAAGDHCAQPVDASAPRDPNATPHQICEGEYSTKEYINQILAGTLKAEGRARLIRLCEFTKTQRQPGHVTYAIITSATEKESAH
jgi:hypothetical protein